MTEPDVAAPKRNEPGRSDHAARRPAGPSSGTPRALSTVAGATAVGLGALVLVGWLARSPLLTRVYPGGRPMVPVTAVTFIVAGCSLLLLSTPTGARWRRVLGRAGALAVTAGAAAVIVAYIAGVDAQSPAGFWWAALPSPHSAIADLALGAALALLDVELGGVRPSEILALCASLIGLLALAGHAFGVAALHSMSAFTGVAPHTALALVLLAAGVFLARPGRGLASLVVADAPSGSMLRWSLPVVIGIPFALGWLRDAGEAAGFFGNEASVAVTVVGTIALLTSFMFLVARVIHRLEKVQRHDLVLLRRSEARYRLLFELNLAGVLWTDRSGRIVDCNASLARTLGYGTKEDMTGLNAKDFYVDPNARASVLSGLQPGGSAKVLEMCWRRRDGTPVWLRGSIRAADSGLVEGIYVDISDEKRLAQVERETTELRSIAMLAAATSHEINNPLAILVGHVSMLKGEIPGNPRIAKILDAIERVRDIVDRTVVVESPAHARHQEVERRKNEGLRLKAVSVLVATTGPRKNERQKPSGTRSRGEPNRASASNRCASRKTKL